jgi:hypothetical protein
MAYDIGNPCPDLGQPQKCVRFKLYNGIPAFPSVICVLEVSILSLVSAIFQLDFELVFFGVHFFYN